MVFSDPFSADTHPSGVRHGTDGSPVLILEGASNGATLPPLGDLLARRGAPGIAARRRFLDLRLSYRSPEATALTVWRHLQTQFATVCVGVIAQGDPAIADASLILAACRVDGTRPGAIALLGFSHAFVASCLRLAGDYDTDSTAARSSAWERPSVIPPEWSPMMIFLPHDDPAIADCASCCRRMRAAGIPICLEIMQSPRAPASSVAHAALADEMMDELDRFFAMHLAPVFPVLHENHHAAKPGA